MRSNVDYKPARLEDFASRLTELESFAGPPAEFWAACLRTMAQLGGAGLAVLAKRRTVEGGATEWQVLTQWSAGPVKPALARAFSVALAAVAEQAQTAGEARALLTGEGIEAGEGGVLAAVSLFRGQAEEGAVAVFLLAVASVEAAEEGVARLRLAAGLPEAYQNRRLLTQARRDVAHFSSVLDLTAMLNGQTRFVATCMLLCNELAARFAPYLAGGVVPHAWLAAHNLPTNDAAATGDADHDGALTWEEYVADTAPTNPAERFLGIVALQPGPGGRPSLAVAPSHTNRYYRAICRPDWRDPRWQPATTWRRGSPGTTWLTPTNPAATGFFRSAVRTDPAS